MLHYIQSAWGGVLGPFLRRTKHPQMAAMCHRDTENGREYLLITSRDTGRWIIPKGWPIDGLSPVDTALQEAWEEAGVRGTATSDDPIGTYCYDKGLDDGSALPVEAQVFSIAVTDMLPTFPEAAERTLKWVDAETAASLVNEPELQALFLNQ